MRTKPTTLVARWLLAFADQRAFDENAATPNPDTDWFHGAKYAVFMHFLPGNARSLASVSQFDVETLAGQLAAVGAKYDCLTLGQNSVSFNSPNAAHDGWIGYAACPRWIAPPPAAAVMPRISVADGPVARRG